MKRPTIIFVTGLPGTGKTTFAKKLSLSLVLPCIGKDTIKELIFDNLGWSDREWSKKAGKATYAIMDYFVEEELKSNRSFILESNFKPKFDNDKFQKLQKTYQYSAIQVVLKANPDILYSRFKNRAKSSQRHPGHGDIDNLSEWKQVFDDQVSEVLDIESKVIEIDTTDFTRVDTAAYIEKIKKALE